VRKVDHVYPPLFLGLPTFWSFMSPRLALAVTGGIGVVSVVLLLLGVSSLSRGSAVMSLSVGLAAILSLYVFVACVRALGHHQVREHFACSGCGLEWSRPRVPRE
jgi:hypothetical protein